MAARSSSSTGIRISIPTRLSLWNAFERGVVEHQAAFASIREANGDDAAGFHLRHDAFAERAVPDRVAGGKGGNVLARRDALGAVGRPGGGPQAFALDRARQLVEEARREVVATRAPEGARRGMRK